MIAKCVRKTGASLGSPRHGNFYTAQTVFSVELGSNYHVLGLGLFETVLLALICDENRKPNWLPIGLFELDHQRLPDNWEFALLDGVAASGGDSSNRWVAKWGYEELVRDAQHSDRLIERDPIALQIFFRELERLRR